MNANTTLTFEDAHRQTDCDLTPETLAMHPWVTASKEVSAAYGLDGALADEDVRDRVVERLITGINTGTIAKPRNTTLATEFLSYPVARLIVSTIDDQRLTTRYVNAEADRSIGALENALWHPSEPFDAHALFDEFDIGVEETTAYNLMDYELSSDDDTRGERRNQYVSPAAKEQTMFRLPFEEYLKVATDISGDEWRLVGRGLNNGVVALDKDEVVPFLRAAIKKRVGERLPREVPDELAERVSDEVEQVTSAIDKDLFTNQIERVEEGLFPPVIRQMLEDFPHNLNHEQKHTLAAFLLNIGMKPDEVVEALGVVGTPGEDPTAYQVKHIWREGDPYMPANYDTITSLGYEWEKDALEQKVKNPLSYYRIKLDDAEDDGFCWLDVYGENVSPILTYPAGPVSLMVDENDLPDGFTVTNNGATWTCDAFGNQHATGLALVAVVEGFVDAEGLSMKFLKEMESTNDVDLCVLARVEYGFVGQPPTYVLESIAKVYDFEFVRGKTYLSKTGRKDARDAFDKLVKEEADK